MERVFEYITPSKALNIEAARQMSLENESAIANLGVRVDDVHLTSPLSFHSAYEKARVGDPSWIEDFESVGFSLLEDLRQALGDECRRGRLRALERERLQAEQQKEAERTRRHNAQVQKSMRDGIL